MTDPSEVGHPTGSAGETVPEPVRTDFIDFPTAWRICVETEGKAEHHEECSYVTNHGVFLCDCAAMPVEWARRAIEQEPHREAEIRSVLDRYLPEHMRQSGSSVEADHAE